MIAALRDLRYGRSSTEGALRGAVVYFGEGETMSTKSEQRPQDPKAQDNQSLAATVASLKRIVYLLLVALLIGSTCFNAYLVWNSITLERALSTGDQRLKYELSKSEFTQRFMVEVHHLGKTNEQVKDLLKKHRQELNAWRLTSRAVEFSQE